MSFSFKTLLISLMCLQMHVFPGFSQVEIQAGLEYPVTTGKNFLNKAYDPNLGFNLGMRFQLNERWFGGVSYSLFKATVTKPELVGLINKTGVTHLQGVAGYKVVIGQTIELSTSLAMGFASYRHFQHTDKFYDYGFGLSIGGGMRYGITDNLGIAMNLAYSRDFLKTMVNRQDRDFFRNVSMINPQLGVAFRF